MASKGQDIDTAAANGAVIPASAFQRLVRQMGELAVLDAANKVPTGEDINPILTAETEDEMWDADERGVYNAKKLSGTSLQIIEFSVRFGEGTDEEIKTPFIDPVTGRQMYLLVSAFRVNDSHGKDKSVVLPEVGEVFTWNTSARNIVGKLWWMLKHGWFDPGATPVRVFMEGTPLSGGKSVEKLKKFTGTATVEAPIIVEDTLSDAPF